jgi:hypothetical protein
MDGTGLSLIKCFENLEDPRVDRTKLHKLIDISSIGHSDIQRSGQAVPSHWQV